MKRALFPAIGFSLLTASCSLLVDFDPDAQRPCAPADVVEDARCVEGFSCVINECVRDGSLALGTSCNKNRQCAADLVCGSQFICTQPCSLVYAGAADDCQSQLLGSTNVPTACTPDLNYTGGGCAYDNDTLRGAGGGALCGDDESACVRLKTGVSVSAETCTISFTSGSPSDDCDDTNEARSCVVADGVDAFGSEAAAFLCEPTGEATQGSPCDLAGTRCADNILCVRNAGSSGSGTCREVCDPSNPTDCTSGVENCEPLTNAPSVGVCEPV